MKAQGTVSGMHGVLAWVSREVTIESENLLLGEGRRPKRQRTMMGWVGEGSFRSFPGGQKLLVPFAAAPNITVLCSPL